MEWGACFVTVKKTSFVGCKWLFYLKIYFNLTTVGK